jgi:hypothetical protein
VSEGAAPAGPGQAAAAAGGELGPLPAAVTRRFAGHDEAALRAPAHRAFLIARLLEEGDAGELRWLFAAIGRDVVAAWLGARGGAALSRRSRAFWSVVLGAESSPPRPLARELWPLA